MAVKREGGEQREREREREEEERERKKKKKKMAAALTNASVSLANAVYRTAAASNAACNMRMAAVGARRFVAGMVRGWWMMVAANFFLCVREEEL